MVCMPKFRCVVLVFFVHSLFLASESRSQEPPPKKVSHIFTSSPSRLEISVGGTLDEFNTRRYTGHYESAFQPNISVTIANTGDTLVLNPRIVVNGRRNWYSIEDILAEIIRPGMTDEEKSFAVWNWCRQNISTGPGGGSTVFGDNASVVLFMNSVGVGACGTFHQAMPHLAKAAGVRSDAGCLANCSHAVQRQYWGGHDRYLDCMLSATQGEQPKGHFALELDNETVAGVNECAEDHYLMDRAAPGDYMNALLHGPGSSFFPIKDDWKDSYRMRFSLRPGESITRNWTPLHENGWSKGNLLSNASGILRYEVKLSEEQVMRYAEKTENLAFAPGGVRPANASRPAELVYRMRVPYLLIGGRVNLGFKAVDPNAVSVAFQFDNRSGEWRELWHSEEPAQSTANIKLPDSEEFHEPNQTLGFLVKVSINPGSSISHLCIEARFQTYIPSLPALSVGKNVIEYVDDSAGPRNVTVSYSWREKNGKVPGPPILKSPVKGAHTTFNPVFEWMPPPDVDVDAYEFYLSARKDMAWPLLGTFHVVSYTNMPKWTPITPDAFLDGKPYYWKVRARSRDGAWGPWSETESFVPHGPGQPRNPRAETSEFGKLILRWDEPSTGTEVVAYEVYGTNEPSFSPLRKPVSGAVWTQKQPVERDANLITVTRTPALDVTDRPECFYRIIALDKAGSRSVPTPCIETSHPVLLPAPTIPAAVGKNLRFDPPLRKNIGKLVWALRGGLVRHNPDELEFALADGPDWLKVDGKEGTVSGVPTSSGEYSFTLEVSNQSAEKHSRRYLISVK